jgi:hypothetical protein
MNQKEKRQLESALIVSGLSNLAEPELLDVFAGMIDQFPGDKHWMLQGLINECEPAQRYEMYHALTPRIRSFKPMPLETYESKIALEAGELISQGRMRVEGARPRAIEIGGHRLAVVPQSQSSGAVAIVRCHRCPKTDRFLADTPAAAMTEARKAGWTREKGVNKECCPECSTAVAETVVRLSNKETMAIYDRRVCKLDA